MEITWNYKIDLADEAVFTEMEQNRRICFPEELKQLIREANAAAPSKYHFMAGTAEKVFGAVLSFNKEEQEADTAELALETVEDKALIPFAIDPFGNYICYHLPDGKIVFWDHETEKTVATDKNLEQFLESLY